MALVTCAWPGGQSKIEWTVLIEAMKQNEVVVVILGSDKERGLAEVVL